jgi:hypothetical protein
MREVTGNEMSLEINLETKSGRVIVLYKNWVNSAAFSQTPSTAQAQPYSNEQYKHRNYLHAQALYISAPISPTIPPAPISTALTAFKF